MSDRLNFPVWADADTNTTGFTLQHLVNGSWVDTDMRTYPMPAGYESEICINRYVEKDIKSTAPDFSYSGTTGITPQPDAYQVYRMDVDGVVTREIGFFNDWSYEMFTGNTRCISAPINRHADARQKLVYGNFAESGNSIIVKPVIVADIKMQPNSIAIGAEQYQTITIVVTSNTEFELILPAWLTASQTAFTSGTTVAYLYPQANTSFDSRQFTIQAKHDAYWGEGYEYTDLAQVAQAGKVAYLTIYPDPLGFAWDTTGLTSVTVNTNTDFTATTNSSDTWFTYSGKTEVGVNYYDVYFNVSANTGDYRQTHAYFEYVVNSSGGTYTRALRVVQAADPAGTVRIYYKASPAQIITPSVTEGFGAVYVGSYNEGSDYYWAFETEPTAIPAQACAGLAPLRNIIAPESVTSIGYSAFTQTNLTGITAPGVTTIGAYAFNANKSLKNVEFGNLTSIGERAFQNCSALTSIDLTHIEYLGQYAFRRCKVLSNVEIGSGITYIPEGCFSVCSGLTSMVIPEGVTGISWQIFTDCYNLSSVTLPSTLIEMGVENGWGGTFYNAYGLTSLTIPDGVKRIHGSLCYNNSIITAVTIPDSVEVLDRGYMGNCLGLKEITIGARVVPLPNSYGSGINCQPSSITLTTGVTEIVENAFGSSNFSATTFYYTGTKAQWAQVIKGKEWVACGTIIHCSDGDVEADEPVLNYVTTDNNYINPRNATGNSSYCYNVRVASYNFTISKVGGHWVVPANAFSGYTNLQSVEMHGVSSVGTYAFYECTSLRSISFDTNLTEIGQLAFCRCTSLSSITLPESLTSMGSGAFRDTSLSSVTIPDSLATIPHQAFYVCTALSSLTIGSGVTEIGSYAFGRCTNLTEINYNNTMAQWENISKGKDWEEWVPAMSIHCTDGDIYLNYKISFTTVYNYPSPTLRETTGYGANLIEYHYDINNDIGVVFFDGAITSIPNSALSRNEMIDTVSIPHTVTSIGDNVFSGCTRLTEIFFSGEIAEWEAITKSSNWNANVPLNVVHCSDGDIFLDYALVYTSTNDQVVTPNVTTYFGANIISNTYSNGVGGIVFDGAITHIPASGFSGCTTIQTIKIPNTVNFIGEAAFSHASGLTEINISDYVTLLGNRAFQFCNGATKITIGSGIRDLGNKTFAASVGFSSLTIPDTVTYMGDETFLDCKGLREVTIGSGVTTIGQYCLGRCNNLATINYNGTKSQWNSITKGNNWHVNSIATVVHCTNGDTPI